MSIISKLSQFEDLRRVALDKYLSAQKSLDGMELSESRSHLSELEKEEIELGLAPDEIEDNIITYACHGNKDRLLYISIILDISARREAFDEHPLINALQNCLRGMQHPRN